MPDRDQQTPESERREREEDAPKTTDLPHGANPDTPQHESAKKTLEDAEANEADEADG